MTSKLTAADYSRIHGSDQDWDTHTDGPLVRAADSASWQEYKRLERLVRESGVPVPLVTLPIPAQTLRNQIAHLTAHLRAGAGTGGGE